MPDAVLAPDSYPVTPRNRVKRLHDRARYDRASVHAILDAAMLCHIAYVIDGQPYCTPTTFWREGDRLYWHGSSASRMLRTQREGVPVCLTVTHLDGLILARSGFNHSVDYRSALCFGRAFVVEEPEEKARALTAMIDRLYPDRAGELRPMTGQELKATMVVAMDIEEAVGKVRAKGVGDAEEDGALPVYAARIPVTQVIGAPEPCPAMPEGVPFPPGLAGFTGGRQLDEIMAENQRRLYGAD
ncbi:MAG TPA: pyridoxamine 5'-phosphate oxidase family protein [Azospirillaceae bacterium]|nr:pyridoxamine 5'-phosphate oxidase family protein [Azospirillaceae bacterium]